MRCIFCKQNSADSKSFEHIIPESLGNTTVTLPPTIVCDKCNNYFARKVEKPFLDSPEIVALRFSQAVPNKRGLVPTLSKVYVSGVSGTAYRDADAPYSISIDLLSEDFERIKKLNKGVVILPTGGSLPEKAPVSRFLAKAGLELLAHRLLDDHEKLDSLIDEAQIDPLRNHARRGDFSQWPYHSRRIYDAHQSWTDELGNEFQVVHEEDLFFTDQGELYFVLALFGLEMTINLGGPDVQGYIKWLEENDNASPLHWGKNNKPFAV